jgi:S1-C subfamily serine protease
MPSMVEVVILPQVNLVEEISFTFSKARSSGSTVLVKSVAPNGSFQKAGIVPGDEFLSFTNIEASKFKDINALLSAFEMIRCRIVRACVVKIFV